MLFCIFHKGLIRFYGKSLKTFLENFHSLLSIGDCFTAGRKVNISNAHVQDNIMFHGVKAIGRANKQVAKISYDIVEPTNFNVPVPRTPIKVLTNFPVVFLVDALAILPFRSKACANGSGIDVGKLSRHSIRELGYVIPLDRNDYFQSIMFISLFLIHLGNDRIAVTTNVGGVNLLNSIMDRGHSKGFRIGKGRLRANAKPTYKVVRFSLERVAIDTIDGNTPTGVGKTTRNT